MKLIPCGGRPLFPAIKRLISRLTKKKHGDWRVSWACRRRAGTLLSSLSDIGQVQQFPVVLSQCTARLMINGALQTLAVAVVRSEEERQEQLRRWLPLTPVQQQQYVSGRGVGVEFLFNRGRKVWHFAHERVHEYPLTGGASSYRRSINPPAALLHDAEKLLTALQWHGVAMVEFKMDASGQYWLMEINPRLWGSLALRSTPGSISPWDCCKSQRVANRLCNLNTRCRTTRATCAQTLTGLRAI